MMPASAVPGLFRYDLEQLAETIAGKDDDVGRLVTAARQHLTRLGLKPAAPPKQQR
jgi:hypothetical protein